MNKIPFFKATAAMFFPFPLLSPFVSTLCFYILFARHGRETDIDGVSQTTSAMLAAIFE